MKEADVHTGGSVANTGLGLKFLGADVSLMGKVGADPFGDMVRNSLRQYQADKGMIIAEEESTSYSVILAIPGVDRIFLHNPGANDTFRASDISEEALQETALFDFGYPPLMRKMYQKNGKELCQLLQKAKKAGAATSLDMSSIDADAEAGKADWAEILKRIIPYVDFFVPSVEELCYMLDRERFASWQEMAGGQDVTEILDIEKDVRPLAEKCMELGAKVLLIKCGARGMYYRTAAGEKIAQIGRRVHLSVDDWAGKES